MMITAVPVITFHKEKAKAEGSSLSEVLLSEEEKKIARTLLRPPFMSSQNHFLNKLFIGDGITMTTLE